MSRDLLRDLGKLFAFATAVKLAMSYGVTLFSSILYALLIELDPAHGRTVANILFSPNNFYGIVFNIFIHALTLLVPIGLYFVFSKKSFSELVYTRPARIAHYAYATFGTAAVSAPISALTIIILSFIGRATGQTLLVESSVSMPDSIWLVIPSAILYCVIPAAEEILIRGIFIGELRRYGASFAIVASAFVFAIMHGSIQQIPFAFVGGLAFGYFYLKFKSIWVTVVAHFLVNFCSLMSSYIYSSATDTQYLILMSFFLVVLSTLAVIIVIYGLVDNRFSIKNDEDCGIPAWKKLATFFINPFLYVLIAVSVSYLIFVLG